MNLLGKTVLITGSRRGIGLEIALAFAKEGANIILNGTKPFSQETLDEFRPFPGKILTIVGDIAKAQQVKSMIDEVQKNFDRIDVLVNNAGITRDGLVLRMSEEDFDAVLTTNLKGCFHMTRAILPMMVKQKSGSIINISSVVGIAGNAGQANYAASKAGMIGFSKSLAKEVGSRNITVNVIAPGYIATEMTDQLSEKIKVEWEKQIPLRRFGKASEVAQAALFLAGSTYITGQVLQVNGGLYM